MKNEIISPTPQKNLTSALKIQISDTYENMDSSFAQPI